MHPDNNMPRRTRRTYEMHSKHNDYKERIREAEENIQFILESDYKPVIEYSGGKDSLVLLHMFMQQDNTIPVYHYSAGYGRISKQTYMPKRIHNELIKSSLIAGVQFMDCVNTPYCRPNYRIGDYFQLLKEFMKEHDCNLECLGIRGGESITRKHRVKAPLIHKEQERLLTFPLKDLTVDDIWTYIIMNDLYYTSYYDKYGRLYGYENVRFTSLFNHNDDFTGGNAFFDNILFSDVTNEEYISNEGWIIGVNEGEVIIMGSKGND